MTGESDAKIMQMLGELSAKHDGLNRRIDDMREDIKSDAERNERELKDLWTKVNTVHDAVTGAKGGYKVLIIIMGAASTIFTAVSVAVMKAFGFIR